ncbi:MAG: hypothetical protein KatS3mg110_2004 [Pirellulaceae bacterium]|nr:MAG: hypothetical protein KatS3mg110_2004 [Pirellulaceae bacterium]
MNRSFAGQVALWQTANRFGGLARFSLACTGLLLVCQVVGAAEPIDFARDVRPILAGHCFKCHGPDQAQRQSGLRLDERLSAIAPADSGKPAIVPGKPEESELVRRIYAEDASECMPPPEEKRPLSEKQKAILRQWIAEGAPYQAHWAFQPIQDPPLPVVRHTAWPKNGIDYFVLARLEAAGLEPNPEADRYTLVRRLYLDLIGIPPTPEEADAFVNDTAPDAYDRLVDRLLASPRYGERWARRWLDLARYADTNGYEKDRPRSIWPYRDWVIRAFNDDMPFDQFTIEQLAGDMLPSPTPSERIATGFHRNTMLNEEGGIDPLEFRFYAMVDRVNTTATTWLGLTLGCAQCHDHKYDPISQREYYQVMAFLNNADEPEYEVPVPELVAERDRWEKEAQAREARLAEKFPPEVLSEWIEVVIGNARSAAGAEPAVQPDGSVFWSGSQPDKDDYNLEFEVPAGRYAGMRLWAISDDRLPQGGPGRAANGNFVLTDLQLFVPSGAGEQQKVRWSWGEAEVAQEGFPAAAAIDEDPRSGWAVHVAGKWNVTRAADFWFAEPVDVTEKQTWRLQLGQQYGGQHTLGRVRLELARALPDQRPIEERRRAHFQKKFAAWLRHQQARAVAWNVIVPEQMETNLPKLSRLDDGSILASGDQTKRDVYRLVFPGDFRGVTALRLEVIPDERLPKRGPGRVYYEGPLGDFFLSEIVVQQSGQTCRLTRAMHSFAKGDNTASRAIDGDPQTGWSIDGGQGRWHTAVFEFAEPLGPGPLEIQMIFERYYAAGLGRFRWSVARTDHALEQVGLPGQIEALLARGDNSWTPEERRQLEQYYLSVCPELASERAAIEQLRKRKPPLPATLVMAERPADNPRVTYVHHRGEFLNPQEPVQPAIPSLLPPLPDGAPANRLSFARWLVSPENPLTARVVVNRQWAAFFGRGIVRTVEDFGIQGELPSHPELLDWLARRWVEKGWSHKALHRLIVTSATYRQAAVVSDEKLRRDPENVLLSRGPSYRVEAEMVRDLMLAAAGLLSAKMYGPSVFPPQPPGITTEGTYGPLPWNVSSGEDRYRRGLYTFMKRTAPFAMFATFDAPSGEECVARREVTNTPLQALTVLNDQLVMEASAAMADQLVRLEGSVGQRVVWLWRRCVTRPPNDREQAAVASFFRRQHQRALTGELDVDALAQGRPLGEARAEWAAWLVTARAVLNLHETVVKP